MAVRRSSTVNATYVYCVVASASRPSAARVPSGLPGATRSRAVPLSRKLWLVTADVPTAMYGEEAVNARLRDLDWVSEIAVGHEAVVEHFTRQRGATVIPMKLLTLFSSDEKARTELVRQRSGIEAAVRRVAGCQEWGIRVLADPAAAPATRSAPTRGVMTGSAFLAARKAAREADRDRRARCLEAAEQAYTSLAGLSRLAKQRPRGSDPGPTPPLLDAAFLVPNARRARFKAAARKEAARCAAAGAQMMLTGPWPVYNFIGDDGKAT
jgi:hypothetical protein